MTKGTVLALVLVSLICWSTNVVGAPPDEWDPTPPPDPVRSVVDIWCDSPSSCYGAGQDLDGVHGWILHFDGSSWTPVQQGPGAFYSVWGSSSSDVFAVGYGGIIYHYDGTSWSPQASHTTLPLRGVWGSGSNDVYAVGGSVSGVALHYENGNWTNINSMLPVNHQFENVWGSGSTCMNIVGGYGNTGVLHFDGDGWRIIPAEASFLTGLWGRSCDDFYAVGHDGSTDAGVFYHCDSSSCQRICEGPFSSRARVPQLWNVAGFGSDVYAVGAYGTIAHWDGTICTARESGTDSFLSGVWANAECDIHVGGIGVLLHSECGPEADQDGDGVPDTEDNCPTVFNSPHDCDAEPGTPDEQCDRDGDGFGDACDVELLGWEVRNNYAPLHIEDLILLALRRHSVDVTVGALVTNHHFVDRVKAHFVPTGGETVELVSIEDGRYEGIFRAEAQCDLLGFLVSFLVKGTPIVLPVNCTAFWDSTSVEVADGRLMNFPIGEPLPTVFDAVTEIPNNNRYVIAAFSPVDLLVEDSSGRQTGMVHTAGVPSGEVNEIPNAIYSGAASEPEFVIVTPYEEETMTLRVNGVASGVYDLSVSRFVNGVDRFRDEQMGIPTELGQSDGYVLTPSGAYRDSDRDGVPDDQDSCPNSQLTATVIIDGRDSGIENRRLGDGCSISDGINRCMGDAVNHGGFVSCVAHTAKELITAGVITEEEGDTLKSTAATSSVGK